MDIKYEEISKCWDLCINLNPNYKETNYQKMSICL